MRKLKLQMQMSADGFVGGPNGELNWMAFKFGNDDKMEQFVNELTDSSDTILLGRKMIFVDYWENVKRDSPEYFFAQKMVNIPKIVFSKTIKSIAGKNIMVENGDLVTEVNKLKSKEGKDILVYGGATFVSNLISENLIDEFNIFVNPTAIGNGLKIFKNINKLHLLKSTAYESGVVANTYNQE